MTDHFRDLTEHITVAALARHLTPQQAARIKWESMTLRDESPEGRRIDEIVNAQREHRWFLFCLDFVARQEN